MNIYENKVKVPSISFPIFVHLFSGTPLVYFHGTTVGTADTSIVGTGDAYQNRCSCLARWCIPSAFTKVFLCPSAWIWDFSTLFRMALTTLSATGPGNFQSWWHCYIFFQRLWASSQIPPSVYLVIFSYERAWNKHQSWESGVRHLNICVSKSLNLPNPN